MLFSKYLIVQKIFWTALYDYTPPNCNLPLLVQTLRIPFPPSRSKLQTGASTSSLFSATLPYALRLRQEELPPAGNEVTTAAPIIPHPAVPNSRQELPGVLLPSKYSLCLQIRATLPCRQRGHHRRQRGHHRSPSAPPSCHPQLWRPERSHHLPKSHHCVRNPEHHSCHQHELWLVPGPPGTGQTPPGQGVRVI